jgi:DNA-binding SARP family transcriptional activator
VFFLGRDSTNRGRKSAWIAREKGVKNGYNAFAMLSLSLLGAFEARRGATVLGSLPKKTQALLAYLALEGASPRTRTELATLLWGDTGDEQALQSLRKALSGLRQALGDDADAILVVQERAVSLNRDRIAVDAIEFERLAQSDEPASIEQAVTIYRGHLLTGFDLDEGPFNEWLLSQRERLRELALNTLARVLDSQIASGATEAAIATAQRLLTLDPLHEPAHRALIRIYARLGRRSAAARQYQLCVDALARELGVKPELATEAAYAESLVSRPLGDPLDYIEDSTIDAIRIPNRTAVPPPPAPVPRRWPSMASLLGILRRR